MIPNIIPPPTWLPQGWSPNALRPTDAAIQQAASQMSASQALTLVAASGSLQWVTITMTPAQVAALNGTPVTVVPAQAGKLIIPIALAKRVNVTGAFSAVVTVALRYIGAGVNAIPAFRIVANGVARYDDLTICTVGFSISTDLRGVGLEISNAAANPAAGTFDANGLHMTCYFAILDWT